MHWPMVIAATIGFSFTSVISSSTGLFIGPISKEFGWSITLASSGMSITSILVFLLSPLFGILIDKWGVRRMAIPGLILMAIVIASLSQLSGSVVQWFTIWTIYAVAALMTKSTVWTASANSTFTAGRGLALGLVLSGAALAQAFVPLATEFLIRTYGWRMAFFWLSLIWGSVAIVLCFLWLRDGYEISREKKAKAVEGTSSTLLDAPGLTVKEAIRNRSIQCIAIASFFVMMVTIGLNVHQFRILLQAGLTGQQAALYALPAGLAGVAGKLITGWLIDRYPARWVGGLTILGSGLTFLILLIPGVPIWAIMIAMMINGYGSGTKLQLVGYLTAAYGGMRKFGTIYGILASLIAAGTGLGPVLGGLVFDTWGSYTVGLWAGLGITMFASLLLFSLPGYPKWSERSPTAD